MCVCVCVNKYVCMSVCTHHSGGYFFLMHSFFQSSFYNCLVLHFHIFVSSSIKFVSCFYLILFPVHLTGNIYRKFYTD